MIEILTRSVELGTAAVITVLVSVATYFFVRWNNYKTLSAKYRDRLYELNKLGVQYGDVAHEFLNSDNFTGTYFSVLDDPGVNKLAASQNLQLVARVRSYVLFRLNFYEEVFYAIEAKHVVFEDRKTWRAYLKIEVHRTLVREVLIKEQAGFGSKFLDFADVRRTDAP